MSDYDATIREINQAKSLEQIERIIWRFSAQAPSESVGGILYSGSIAPGLKAEQVAIALSEKTGASIINNTPRGQFLGSEAVTVAIKNRAAHIFESKGLKGDLAERAAIHFLYGNTGLSPGNYLSIHNCLWCKSSREFVASLRGDVLVVAKGASPDRVLGQVELPAALANPKINTIGGIPHELLQSIQRTSGTPHALLISQNAFIEAEKGITRDVHGKVQLSPQAMSALGADKLAKDAAQSAALAHPPVLHGGISARTLAVTGLKAAGAAAMVYDTLTTANETKHLHQQHNSVGAQSEVLHFAGRNMGMWGGATAGALLGAAAGIESGPGLLVSSIVGGVVGAVAGDRLMDRLDQRRIYNQQDRSGNTWHFDPRHPDQGWTREVPYGGPTALRSFPLDDTHKSRPGHWPNIAPLDGVPHSNTHPIRADVGLSNTLNYKASSTAAKLALADCWTRSVECADHTYGCDYLMM